jgi:integrase
MPRRKKDGSWKPPLRPHRGPDGRLRARVRIGGVDHYCGPWESPDLDRYHRLVTEWLVAGPAATAGPGGPSVAELLTGYLEHAEVYYVRRGAPTAEVYHARTVGRVVDKLYGTTPAREFGALQLLAVREEFLRQVDGRTGKRWSRAHVNGMITRVRRVWRWGHERGLVPASCLESLRAVNPLKRTKTVAPEGRKVGPVAPETFAATLPHLGEPARALAQVHRLLGCRADEACRMRLGDVDRAADPASGCWRFTPDGWKTEWADGSPLGQHYWVGPAARSLLEPLLAACAAPDAPVFRTRGGRPYPVRSYHEAVARACRRAGVPHWSPGRVRHLRLTEVELAEHAAGRQGEEAAQAVGGHSDRKTTRVYVERSELARRVMTELG